MRRAAAVMLALLGAMVPARAAVISGGPDKVAVTVYHDPQAAFPAELYRSEGMAMITETRGIDLPTGVSEIRLKGVADTMVPETADLDGLPKKPSEADFNYDLLSDGRLIAGSLGRTVHLVRTDTKTGAVTEIDTILRTGPQGVMLERDGKLEALECSGLPEKLVFDRVPEEAQDVPTLVVRAEVPSAGHYVMTLRYLATGLNWAASYVARASADGRSVDLSGWITLTNGAEVGFPNAPVDVIAGRYNATGDDQPPNVSALTRQNACWPTLINWGTEPATIRARLAAPPAPSYDSASPVVSLNEAVIVTGTRIEARAFGDYKQYPLPEPTTVAARQTKQVQFLDSRDIAAERIYAVAILPSDLAGNDDIELAQIVFRLRNDVSSGLGKPLPAGNIATIAKAPGGDVLMAEDSLSDTPVGSPMEIPAGQAKDVWLEKTLTESRRVKHGGQDFDRQSMTVTIANQKAVPVTFELWQGLEGAGTALVSESRSHRMKSGALVWTFALRPGERSVMRYVLDVAAD